MTRYIIYHLSYSFGLPEMVFDLKMYAYYQGEREREMGERERDKLLANFIIIKLSFNLLLNSAVIIIVE